MKDLLLLISGTLYFITIMGLYGMICCYKVKIKAEHFPTYFMVAGAAAGLNYLLFYHTVLYFVLSGILSILIALAVIFDPGDPLVPETKKDAFMMAGFMVIALCLGSAAIFIPIMIIVIYHRLDEKH